MKIFITGATGFIGSKLVKNLAKKHKVTALVRNMNKAKKLPKNVKIVLGDITNLEVLKKATKGIDVVYHLAGVKSSANIDDSSYYDINVKGTENIVMASNENKIKHFVYCGSSSAYGHVDNETQFLKEDHPCYGQDIYGKTKYEGELVTKKYCKIPYTILRLARVFSKEDLTLLIIYKLIKKGIMFNLGGGKSIMMPVFVEDVVDAFKKCTLNKKTYRKVYNIAGKDVLTKKDFFKLIANKMNKKPLFIYLPIKPTLFIATIIEFLFKLIRKEPPVSRKKLNFLLLSRKYDISTAKRDFGWVPKKDLSKGVEDMFLWYKNNNYL